MKINFIKLRSNAVAPVYGTSGAAGADLHACTDTEITFLPGQTHLVPTGIAMEIPAGYVGLVFARSGLSTKRGLAPANKVGVIDSDYRGEIFVPIHNHSSAEETISPAERIAQILIVPVAAPEFVQSETLTDTVRGENGFGSTGK